MSDVQQRIDALVKGHKVVLFMKGTAQFPQCGFSGRAIQILKACGVQDIATVNVLEDEEIRQGIPSHVTADLNVKPLLSVEELRERMSGNICRCGAYSNIIDAITEVGGVKA